MKIFVVLFVCIQLGDFVSSCDVLDTVEERNAIIDSKEHWPKKNVPYLIDKSIGLKKDKSKIQKALKAIRSKTCIKFVVRKKEKNYLKFTSDTKRCFASVGMKGGEQLLEVGNGCMHEPQLIHLIVHTLGFFHEHNRPDRDTFVKIDLDNVKEEFKPRFTARSNKTTTTYDYMYDYHSVMHYGSHEKAKDPKKPTIMSNFIDTPVPKKNPEKLSPTDIKKIRRMYKCGK